jgi:hypothetical protein
MKKCLFLLAIGIIAVSLLICMSGCPEPDDGIIPTPPPPAETPEPDKFIIEEVENGGNLDFGTVLWEGSPLHNEPDVHEEYVQQSITIKNTGTDPCMIPEITFDPQDGDYSSITSFPRAIMPGSSRQVIIEFRPVSNGNKTATLSLSLIVCFTGQAIHRQPGRKGKQGDT